MFANRRVTGVVPVKTESVTSEQFERKPKKQLLETT